jgi:anion-transporting  ArsA/GET3 family ATPase
VIAARLPWNTFFFFFFKDRATATTGRCRKADGASEFVRNRVAMQAGYLREIRDAFDGQVRAVLPLYDSDLRGVASLERAADRLFA